LREAKNVEVETFALFEGRYSDQAHFFAGTEATADILPGPMTRKKVKKTTKQNGETVRKLLFVSLAPQKSHSRAGWRKMPGKKQAGKGLISQKSMVLERTL